MLLLTKNVDQEGHFYLFPGGGQEHGEVLTETVARECIEEVGENVEVKNLLHIREYIGQNHEHASFDSHVHQVEYYFVCRIKRKFTLAPMFSNPDIHQVGIEWVPIQDLLNYRIYPKEIRKYIQDFEQNKVNDVYLGDIN